MKMRFCPSCKNKISDSTKKCSVCGLIIPAKTHDRMLHPKIISIALVVIILTLALSAFIWVSERGKLIAKNDSQEIIQAETLLSIDGTEFTPSDIMAKFNSFMQDSGTDSMSIKDLIFEPGNKENIYRETKDNISITMVTHKERTAVTSVSVLAESGKESPDVFIKYCFALMNIFTPTMKAGVRQKVLYNMMGFVENGSLPLHEGNTYIIVDTKYTYTCSEQSGLSMLIEQMPKLQLYSGDHSVK